MQGILHTNRRRLTKCRSPRTARGELGPTWLSEVDGVVTVDGLGGVRRASTRWE